MDPQPSENQFTMSETFEQRVARLEENYRRGSDEMVISRRSLTKYLEEATTNYLKSFRDDNKVDALTYDGFVRAFQAVFDLEIRK